jgi:hypothetical protein
MPAPTPPIQIIEIYSPPYFLLCTPNHAPTHRILHTYIRLIVYTHARVYTHTHTHTHTLRVHISSYIDTNQNKTCLPQYHSLIISFTFLKRGEMYTYKSEKDLLATRYVCMFPLFVKKKTCSPLVRNTFFGCIILCSSGASHGTCK